MPLDGSPGKQPVIQKKRLGVKDVFGVLGALVFLGFIFMSWWIGREPDAFQKLAEYTKTHPGETFLTEPATHPFAPLQPPLVDTSHARPLASAETAISSTDNIGAFRDFMNVFATFLTEAGTEKLAPGGKLNETVIRVDSKKSDYLEYPVIYEAVLRTRIIRSGDGEILVEHFATLDCANAHGRWHVVREVGSDTRDLIAKGPPIGVEAEKDPAGTQKVFDVLQRSIR